MSKLMIELTINGKKTKKDAGKVNVGLAR